MIYKFHLINSLTGKGSHDTKQNELKRMPRSPDPEADPQRRKRQFVRHQSQPRQYRRPIIVTPAPDVKVSSSADSGIERRFFSTKKRNSSPVKKTTRSPLYEPPAYGPPTYSPQPDNPPLSVIPEEQSSPAPPALYYDFKPTKNPYLVESYTTSVDDIPGPPYDPYVYETRTTAWPSSYSVTTSPSSVALPGSTYYKPIAPSQNSISDTYASDIAGTSESIYREETNNFQPGTVVNRGSKELVRWKNCLSFIQS